MKKLVNFVIVILFTLVLIPTQAQEQKQEKADETISSAKKIEVYYFHGTRRCETCKAVGEVSSNLVDTKYEDMSNVSFVEVDYDQDGNEEIVEKFEVASSGLYVYDQNEIVNLTTYAFQYAKTNPDKLRTKLKTTINKMLK